LGLGAAALPKTIYKIASEPNGLAGVNIAAWYFLSSRGVTNIPNKNNE
jgi:hypothetical protein